MENQTNAVARLRHPSGSHFSFEPLPTHPITQKARSKLHQELRLLLKVGYQSGATGEQKMQRYDEVRSLLDEDRAQNPDKYR